MSTGSTPDPRERLMLALTSLAAECGYRNLTLLALLERAAVSEAEFHRHFDDLEDCFRAAIERNTQELLVRVATAFAAEQRWVDALRAVAYELRDFLYEDEPRARIMVIEVLDAGPDVIAIREQGIAALTELIDLGRRELDDPDSVPRLAAEIVAGAIYNHIHVVVEHGVASLKGQMLGDLMFTAVLPYLGIEAALEELHVPPPLPSRPDS